MADQPLAAPCPCGSGATYIRCCGQLDPRIWGEAAPGRLSETLTTPRWFHLLAQEPQCDVEGKALPPGILLRDLAGQRDWQEVAAAVACESRAQPARVVAGASDLRTSDLRKSVWRETEIVDQGPHAEQVLNLVRRIYRDVAEPFYRCRLRSLETPHILRYSGGSYYRPHADSDQFNSDTNRWEKTLDRDLSLLLYLDDDYEGGELAFPNLDFELRPRAGMLLMFPSDFRYLHGVRPVTRGRRHTIVSWCAVQAGNRQAPPA